MTSSCHESSIANQRLALAGMSCAGCVKKVETALGEVPGVEQVTVNFAEREAQIWGSAKEQALISAVEAIGYGASSIQRDELAIAEKEVADQVAISKLMKQCIAGISVGGGLMAYGLLGGSMMIHNANDQIAWGIVAIITLAIIFYSGHHFYTGAWKAFVNHTADMNTLIAVGTGSAWLFSTFVVIFPSLIPAQSRHLYFEASAMIIGLVNLGLVLESRARGKASQAIKELIGLQPKTVHLILDNQEIDIPIAEVVPGNNIRVKPGEKVPVDGTLLDGYSSIDESMLTGEPIPIEKTQGSSLFTGTLNQSGSFIMEAKHVGSQTALAQIIKLVRNAQNSKPEIGKLADAIAAVFVPTVLIIAVLTALVWYNFGPQPQLGYMLVTATTVLIIACPCALGLATPMSIIVGVGRAAQQGVLIRNGDALQTASKLSTIILDKTGTITEGKPSVADIISLHELPENDILRLVASLENASEHPLASAIVAETNQRNLTIKDCTHFNATVGFGVSGELEGMRILFGKKELLNQSGINTDIAEEHAKTLQHQGKTVMYAAVDMQLIGLIAVADSIKKSSIKTIKQLQSKGIEVLMLTGDNENTARAVANRIGVDNYVANVLPQDKKSKVCELQQQGKLVGMVGDGINDAPALAQADVGFAISNGSDIAIESADITLMRSSITGVVEAINISKATVNNIKQNLFGAFVYNGLGIPVAAGILFPITGGLLNPIFAGAAMAMSSFTVVSNANRLRFINSAED